MLTSTVLLIALALVLRIVPGRLAPHGAGVDQWFWRAYIDALRRTRRLPIELPQFLLDRAQWYPPLFPWLLARLPAIVFDHHATLMSILIDLLRMLLLLGAIWAYTADLGAVVAAGSAYAMTPLLITYNMQLNPRGLGALFLDAMWLVVASILLREADMAWWLAVAGLSGLVLLTHKMTTQLMWFTACAGALLAVEPRLLLVVPAGIAAALVLSGGFYRRVFIAHVDIVRFWFRNWPWSGAHPVRDSPIYGEPGYESPGRFYRSGTRAWLRRLMFVLGFNPWMPAALAIGALAWWDGQPFARLETWVFGWLALSFAFALLTTIVPALRCLGQGYLYCYNGAFPAALALGLSWPTFGGAWYWWAGTGATALASVAALTTYFRRLRASRTMKVDVDLDAAIRRLAELPNGVVMCLPQHWHDVVAYRTKHPVLFGGHGYGFSLLQSVFPVLRSPIGEIAAQHRVAYLLTLDGFLPLRVLDELPRADVEAFGDYRLYRFGSPAVDVELLGVGRKE